MSYLNLNRNIFLEKEELVRFQDFLANDVSKVLFLKNTTYFGIVLSDFVSHSDFEIEVGTNSGTIKLVRDSYALDSDGLLIHQLPFDNLAIPDDSTWYWVKVTHKYDPVEVGTLSISAEGVLSGTNTLFQDVLRGSSTDVPIKIKFLEINGSAPTNDQVYEVVSVIDNTNAIVTGGSFSAESDLKYVVIGSTPISETITANQLTGLYQYDACTLVLVTEEFDNTIPVINYTIDKDFYLARVKNIAGTVTVQDKRTQWWLFDIPGLADKLNIASNLSDLQSVSTARTNLSVYSKAEIDALIAIYFQDTGWIYMTRGVNCDAAGFDVKIRRRGQMVTITGMFTTATGIVDDGVLFTVLLSALGSVGAPTTRVYGSSSEISSNQVDRGVKFYIDPPTLGDTTLQVKVLSHYSNTDCIINLTYISN
jgi:hypothetical protein